MGGAGVLRIRILYSFIRSRLCFSVKIRTHPYQLEALRVADRNFMINNDSAHPRAHPTESHDLFN